MRTAFRSCALFIVAFAFSALAQSNQQPSAVPTLQPPTYQHWLDEDVHWIISAEEQKAFESLRDNGERDQFIVQFWLRRDPTPGTSENEFKEEHYRRLAYSNQHFAASTLGDLTDRGHIYVVYGPPDAIQHRLVNGAPAEIWHYQILARTAETAPYEEKRSSLPNPADFSFVDNCQCGDYRLTIPSIK